MSSDSNRRPRTRRRRRHDDDGDDDEREQGQEREGGGKAGGGDAASVASSSSSVSGGDRDDGTAAFAVAGDDRDDDRNPLYDFLRMLDERGPEGLGASLLYGAGAGDSSGATTTNTTRSVLLEACRHLFERVERLGALHERLVADTAANGKNNFNNNHPILSGLAELYTGETTSKAAATAEDAVVDGETVWGQVELQNEPLQSLLKKSVKKLSKKAAIASNESSDDNGNNDQIIKLLDVSMESSDDDGGDDQDAPPSSSDDDDDDHDDDDGHKGEEEDEETRRIKARMERAMADMEDDEDDEKEDRPSSSSSSASEESEEEEDGGGTLPTKSAGKKDSKPAPAKRQKQDDTGEEEDSLVDPAAEELNDGFFDIQEMEAFADEEEEYLPDDTYGQETADDEEKKNGSSSKKKVVGDTRSFHQRQRDGDFDVTGSDDDEEDEHDGDEDNDLLFRKAPTTVRRRKYREDDEVEALYSMYEAPRHDRDADAFDDGDDDDSEAGGVINMTAADIFGKPNKKYLEKWKSKGKKLSRSNEKKGENVDRDDDDSWNDYDFDAGGKDNDAGWGRPQQDENDSENEDEDVPMKTDEDGEEGSSGNARINGGGGGGQSSRLLQQTEQLEQEMLAEKPWQMRGESTSTSRPVNSLLDSTPEFEVATKMAPIVTVQHTASLEEVIKQRILNEDWDDVIPRELPDVGWNLKRGELPEVSQEKSKLGLGELYEREFLKKAAGYDVDAAEKESAEEKAKNEMKSLFANLCSKLDALSNYHFAPRPVAPDADVKVATKPAIAMEEVLPLHVSDARGSAPQEIYAAKRGRDGVLRADSELDQGDRKRLRAAKKAKRRKARKEKQADEKLISRLQPGLGLNNPYEKRKMREELSLARAHGKVTTGAGDDNDYGASGTFFKRMQQEAEQAVRGETSADDKSSDQRKKSSSAFKL